MFGINGDAIIYLIIIVVVFLLLREVNCWYWKINKGLEKFEEINENLNELVRLTKKNNLR